MNNPKFPKLPNTDIPSLFLADTVRYWVDSERVSEQIARLEEQREAHDLEYIRRAAILESNPETFGPSGYFEVELQEGFARQRYAVSLDQDGLVIRRQRRDYAPLAEALQGPEPGMSDEAGRDRLDELARDLKLIAKARDEQMSNGVERY